MTTIIERRRAVIESVLDGHGEANCPDCGGRLWWRWRSAGDAVKTSCDTCRIDEDITMLARYRHPVYQSMEFLEGVSRKPSKPVVDLLRDARGGDDEVDHALGICKERELQFALQFLVDAVDHSKHVETAMKRARQVLKGLS